MREDYALRVTIDALFDEALARVKSELKAEGFGVLTEIDVRETFREKLGVDFRPYAILGACNPPLSHRALSHESDAGLVLPCNVIVYQDDAGTTVAIADPTVIARPLGKPALEGVSREAREKLARVAAALRN